MTWWQWQFNDTHYSHVRIMWRNYNRFVCRWCDDHRTAQQFPSIIVNIIGHCVAWQWFRGGICCCFAGWNWNSNDIIYVEMIQIEIRKQFCTFLLFFWLPLIWIKKQYTTREPRRPTETKIISTWLWALWAYECSMVYALCNHTTYCVSVSIYCKWSLAVLCKQFTWVRNTLRYCAHTHTHNHK